jgi:DNA (cytosine-5)-methyltransferase 1
MAAYYNEIDPYCAVWLQALMAENLIPRGAVDTRPIQEVPPEDLDGFKQVHFFAGIGGWACAAQLAGWPEDRELWTGSCPCQPFSSAGRQLGFDDPRHLWPDFFRLIRARRPAVVLGEQTAAALGYAWLDRVGADLDSEDYAWRACDIPAASVNAPHIRNRLYWLAHCTEPGLSNGRGAPLGKPTGAVAEPERLRGVLDGLQSIGVRSGRDTAAGASCFWNDYILAGPDPKGKYRRVKSGVRLLAHGIPGRVGLLRGYGNAIVPQQAAEVIRAWMDVMPIAAKEEAR